DGIRDFHVTGVQTCALPISARLSWLAVPLYAHAEGLSNGQIGALFALPVLAQVPLNLAGGAYTDRIGGQRIMLGSCWAAIVAGRSEERRVGKGCRGRLAVGT